MNSHAVLQTPGIVRIVGSLMPESIPDEELAAIRTCLLYTSDAADERSSVDLGGRRIIKKKKRHRRSGTGHDDTTHASSSANRADR